MQSSSQTAMYSTPQPGHQQQPQRRAQQINAAPSRIQQTATFVRKARVPTHLTDPHSPTPIPINQALPAAHHRAAPGKAADQSSAASCRAHTKWGSRDYTHVCEGLRDIRPTCEPAHPSFSPYSRSQQTSVWAEEEGRPRRTRLSWRNASRRYI